MVPLPTTRGTLCEMRLEHILPRLLHPVFHINGRFSALSLPPSSSRRFAVTPRRLPRHLREPYLLLSLAYRLAPCVFPRLLLGPFALHSPPSLLSTALARATRSAKRQSPRRARLFSGSRGARGFLTRRCARANDVVLYSFLSILKYVLKISPFANKRYIIVEKEKKNTSGSHFWIYLPSPTPSPSLDSEPATRGGVQSRCTPRCI